jgi:adenosylhomocysteine nucleosidase
VCAMPMELSPLRRPLGLTKARIGSVEAHRGTLDGRPVVALVTGMGTDRAGRHVADLLDAAVIDRVAVVGIAGSLEAGSVIGTLVRPEVVVDAATGVHHVPEQLGSEAPSGMLWTSDELVTDPEAADHPRSLAVVGLDMETAAVARECEQRGVPWSVYRCISDRVTDGIVDDEFVRLSRADGTPDVRAVASHVARHPGRVPELVRMARAATLAAGNAAASAVREVSAAPPPRH